ncbi:MAG TPA: DUF2079 domain-containing protein [Pyrinomonadaceae bacterium]|nr:DUF2079 domain-containing protein [Pyrinomonadaceae bacterium]
MDQSTNSSAADSVTTNNGRKVSRAFAQWIVRWLLFFLICMSLGYASVERYQPRSAAGLTDAAVYYRLVAGQEVQGRDMRFRLLVPYVARPFYLLGSRFLNEERSISLALLIANAIFCATTACLLVSVALRLTGKAAVALLAACLYLLNFAVANLQLAGMVDAGEACFMMALTWSLIFDRWRLLPVWGVCGALAKETFVPLAGVFTLGWWLSIQREQSDRGSKLFWATAMFGLGIIAIIISRLSITASFDNPGTLAGSGGISAIAGGVAEGGLFLSNPGPGYLSRLTTTLSSRTFWYVFVWLLPLGLAGLKRLPRPWVIAAGVGGVLALGLGIYRNIEGNVARPIFDVMGPMLSLSAAIWLSRSPGENNSLPVDQHSATLRPGDVCNTTPDKLLESK